MRTSYEVTLIARPRFGGHRLANYLSNGVRPSVVYQCFEANVILFVALSICYLTLALSDPHQLNKARTLPWVEVVHGEFEGERLLARSTATLCTHMLVLVWRKARGNPRSPDQATAPCHVTTCT